MQPRDRSQERYLDHVREVSSKRVSDTNQRLYNESNGHKHTPQKVEVLRESTYTYTQGYEPKVRYYALVCSTCRTPLYEIPADYAEYLELAKRESEQ